MQNYNTLANMPDELVSEVVLLTFMCTGGQMQIQGKRKKGTMLAFCGLSYANYVGVYGRSGLKTAD